MVHDLEVPLPLTGLQIDAHDAVAEQIIARPMTAVEVRRGILHGQIDRPGFEQAHRARSPRAVALTSVEQRAQQRGAQPGLLGRHGILKLDHGPS